MLDNLETLALKALRRLRVALILSLTIMTPAMATDLDHEVVFHIKSQRLDSALLEFFRQANTPVAFAAKSIGSLITPGLDGKYPARTALSALLCNSGLVYTQVGDTVTVVPTSSERNIQPCRTSSDVTHRD